MFSSSRSLGRLQCLLSYTADYEYCQVHVWLYICFFIFIFLGKKLNALFIYQFCWGILTCCSYKCWQYRWVQSWTWLQSGFFVLCWFTTTMDFLEHKCWWFSFWVIKTFMQTMGKRGFTKALGHLQAFELVWEA